MTNEEYYNNYVNNMTDTLKQLTNEDVIKLVLEQYRQFVLTYDMMEKQADMFGMSVVEYRNHMDNLLHESL